MAQRPADRRGCLRVCDFSLIVELYDVVARVYDVSRLDFDAFMIATPALFVVSWAL